MTDPDIDQLLAHGAPPAVDPALVDRISRRVQGDLRPVLPLPPVWCFALTLLALSCTVSVAGALHLGLYGLHKLTVSGAVKILVVLGVLMVVAAVWNAARMVPGSWATVSPAVGAAIASVVLLGLFGLMFHDYSMASFFPQGVACLKAGLWNALPAALFIWVVVGRGFHVHPIGSGATAGGLAGLAGVLMLELHCPNFKAPHILVWHVAVLPLSCLGGALAGWAGQRFGAKRSDAELMQ